MSYREWRARRERDRAWRRSSTPEFRRRQTERLKKRPGPEANAAEHLAADIENSSLDFWNWNQSLRQRGRAWRCLAVLTAPVALLYTLVTALVGIVFGVGAVLGFALLFGAAALGVGLVLDWLGLF